jgi:hypothetical protein
MATWWRANARAVIGEVLLRKRMYLALKVLIQFKPGASPQGNWIEITVGR